MCKVRPVREVRTTSYKSKEYPAYYKTIYYSIIFEERTFQYLYNQGLRDAVLLKHQMPPEEKF